VAVQPKSRKNRPKRGVRGKKACLKSLPLKENKKKNSRNIESYKKAWGHTNILSQQKKKEKRGHHEKRKSARRFKEKGTGSGKVPKKKEKGKRVSTEPVDIWGEKKEPCFKKKSDEGKKRDEEGEKKSNKKDCWGKGSGIPKNGETGTEIEGEKKF